MHSDYVYRQIVPLLQPSRQKSPDAWWVLSDGRYDPAKERNVKPVGPEEERLPARANGMGDPGAYLLAVYGRGTVGLAKMDGLLRSQATKGYMGRTSLRGDDSHISGGNGLFRYWDTCRMLGLAGSCRIEGARFVKRGFNFMSDGELRALGFEPGDAPPLGPCVGKLLDIYGRHRTFMSGEGKSQAREIGTFIHEYYGFHSMRLVCDTLRQQTRSSAAAELESVWDGIGGWMR